MSAVGAAGPAAPPPPRTTRRIALARLADRVIDRGHRLWWWVAAVALAWLVGVRAVRYLPLPTTPEMDHRLGTAMILMEQTFIWPFGLTSVFVQARLLLIITAILVVLFRRRIARLVRRADGCWRFSRLMVSLSWGAILWNNYLLDLNPFVGLVCAVSLAVAWTTGALAGGNPWGTAATGAALVAGVALAPDAADAATVVVWGLTLVAARVALRGVGGREVTLALVFLTMVMNLFAAAVPRAVPLHAGRRLGDGMAFGFCETPRLFFASIPVCTSVVNPYAACRDGRVVAYDRTTLAPVSEFRPFSPDYFGRLETVVCLDTEVVAAVQATRYRGRRYKQTALSFPIDAPDKWKPFVEGGGVGTAIAYDAANDALFYGGEHTHRVLRLDRRTGAINDRVGEPLLADKADDPVGLFTGSLNFNNGSIHARRNRLYVADWLMGRHVHGLDLSSLEFVERYDVEGGGALGVAVDEERDRLLVGSVWGLEVISLASGRVVVRLRMGLGTRPPIVDTHRNRLYVTSTSEGKIRVLDRDTFEVIRQVPIGMGPRFLYLTADGRQLLGGTSWAHYVFDPDALVQ